jgi:hypothetical protein
MGKVDQFLHDLKHYDKDNIHPSIIKNVKPYLSNVDFNVDVVSTKSAAAAGKYIQILVNNISQRKYANRHSEMTFFFKYTL